MSPAVKLTIRITLGIVFLILGIVGSLLPVLQGWIFFLLAFLVLFPKTKAAEKILTKADPKMPKLVAWLRKMDIGTQEPQERQEPQATQAPPAPQAPAAPHERPERREGP